MVSFNIYILFANISLSKYVLCMLIFVINPILGLKKNDTIQTRTIQILNSIFLIEIRGLTGFIRTKVKVYIVQIQMPII